MEEYNNNNFSTELKVNTKILFDVRTVSRYSKLLPFSDLPHFFNMDNKDI